MRRMLFIVVAVAFALGMMAGPALAAGPQGPAPEQGAAGCTGTNIAFTAPAAGVDNMNTEVAGALWFRYSNACDHDPEAFPGG